MNNLLPMFTPQNKLDEVILSRRVEGNRLLHVAWDAIEPRIATRRALQTLQGHVDLHQCTVFAVGKAALGMAQGVLDEVQVKDGLVHCFDEGHLGPLKLVQSAHPFPAPDAAERGREMLEMANALSSDDVALCLISGGGSAMLECPRPGVTMERIQRETNELMKAGVAIEALNQRRRTLSAIKGGGLASAIAPAKVITLVISDTPGAPLETVASGPSLPSDHVVVVADHLTARHAVLNASPMLRSYPELISGEASDQGAYLSSLQPGFVATGETTVTVKGEGFGGRNQELALGALQACLTRRESCGLFIAIGTDGIDGRSDAAGAWFDEEVLSRATDPKQALMNNDSATYFSTLGAQIKTGPTGTNVADLILSLS